MVSTLLIIVISFLVFLSAFLSNDNKLYDKRFKGFKILTKMGWWVLGVNIIIIATSFLQFHLSEMEAINRDNSLRKSYEKSVERIRKNQDDNTIKLKFIYDTSVATLKDKYDTSTSNIIRALATYYGLQYDSAKKVIARLEKITVGLPPDLHLATENEIVWDSIKNHFQLNFESSDAPSKNFDIQIYILVKVDGNFYPYSNSLSIGKNSEIPKDKIFYLGFTLPFRVEEILFYIKGTYTNFIGDQPFSLEDIYSYSIKGKRTVQLMPVYFEKYKKEFEKYIQQKRL